jgi:DNA-binding transcriptional regulator YiaG
MEMQNHEARSRRTRRRRRDGHMARSTPNPGDGGMGGHEVTATHWCYEGEALREPILYRGCGLDDVYLRGGYERVQTPEGEGIVVKHLDELRKAITLYLVTEKKALTGKELRFLRQQLDLTQAELGRRLRLSDQQVARWEKDKCEISGPADALLRLHCLKKLGAKVDDPLKLIEELIEQDDRADRAVFAPTRAGWRKAA